MKAVLTSRPNLQTFDLPTFNRIIVSSEPVIELPVGRSRSLTRASLWGVVAALVVVPLRAVFERLNFVPTAFSNRLVDYSFVLLALPFVLLAVSCVIKSMQWLLLASWPGKIGIFADENELTLRLGPFGTRRFDTKRLDIRYPFERREEEDEGGFEALLPEEDQRRNLLPHMFVWHRFPAGAGQGLETRTKRPVQVDRLILRFASGSESDLAARLRPLIERWREKAE